MARPSTASTTEDRYWVTNQLERCGQQKIKAKRKRTRRGEKKKEKETKDLESDGLNHEEIAIYITSGPDIGGSQAEVTCNSLPCCPHYWLLSKASATWTARWLQQRQASCLDMTPRRKQRTVCLEVSIPGPLHHPTLARTSVAVEPWPLELPTMSWALCEVLWTRQSSCPQKSHTQSRKTDKYPITAPWAIRKFNRGIWEKWRKFMKLKT